MTNQSIDQFKPPLDRRADDLLGMSAVVNKFMDVPRATIRGDRHETDGDHSLHLQFIAVAYAAEYHPELDIGKVSQYALVHDFVEVYAGDVNSLQATPEALSQKALTEKVAFDRLERELDDTWPYFVGLIEKYESLEDPEARFVKCFDKLDASISHIHNRGEALLKMGVATREEYAELTERVRTRMTECGDEFPDVVQLRKELIARVTDITYPPV